MVNIAEVNKQQLGVELGQGTGIQIFSFSHTDSAFSFSDVGDAFQFINHISQKGDNKQQVGVE